MDGGTEEHQLWHKTLCSLENNSPEPFLLSPLSTFSFSSSFALFYVCSEWIEFWKGGEQRMWAWHYQPAKNLDDFIWISYFLWTMFFWGFFRLFKRWIFLGDCEVAKVVMIMWIVFALHLMKESKGDQMAPTPLSISRYSLSSSTFLSGLHILYFLL